MEEGIEMDSFEGETHNVEELEIDVKKSSTSTIFEKLRGNQKLSILGTVCKFFVVIFLFALLASNVVLWYNYYETKDLDQPSELEITAEFQIVLKSSDWTNRERQLGIFFSYFQEISGYPFLDQELVENYRVQSYFKPDNCSTDWKVDFRLRNYFLGPASNTSTLDAKISSISYEEGLIAPLEPSDDQLEHSFQKLEHDMHACFDKYSRESRVQDIPYQPVIRTCGDVHKLYPYLWSDSHSNGIMEEGEPEYWYTAVYSGTFDNGVVFKSDVTLEYNTMEDLVSDKSVAPKSGEYSLRIWSTHIGHGPWDQDSFDEIEGWFHQLLTQFDSDDYPCS